MKVSSLQAFSINLFTKKAGGFVKILHECKGFRMNNSLPIGKIYTASLKENFFGKYFETSFDSDIFAPFTDFQCHGTGRLGSI